MRIIIPQKVLVIGRREEIVAKEEKRIMRDLQTEGKNQFIRKTKD